MPSKRAPKTTATPLPTSQADKQAAVIFDIDGTLADSSHRFGMIADWSTATNEQIEEYAALYVNDEPIAPVVELARSMNTMGYHCVMLTSRDITQYERTKQWLKDYGIPCHALYVRQSIDDRRPNPTYKEEQLAIIREKYRVVFAVDDEKRVADMYRLNGVMCLQCNDYGV
jgi:HAD superfamily, subfamily IIIB (Acid phosphatase)